jgi:hypothetical protein
MHYTDAHARRWLRVERVGPFVQGRLDEPASQRREEMQCVERLLRAAERAHAGENTRDGLGRRRRLVEEPDGLQGEVRAFAQAFVKGQQLGRWRGGAVVCERLLEPSHVWGEPLAQRGQGWRVKVAHRLLDGRQRGQGRGGDRGERLQVALVHAP